MNIQLVEKDYADIGLIGPLWEQLNALHEKRSIFFKEKYQHFTFDKRMESIHRKAERGMLKIDLLYDLEVGSYVGYCLSSIEGQAGEIESIFIKEAYRKYALGDRLMRSALDWFALHSITNIQIGVVYNNEDALPFYAKYGFHIAGYTLKQM